MLVATIWPIFALRYASSTALFSPKIGMICDASEFGGGSGDNPSQRFDADVSGRECFEEDRPSIDENTETAESTLFPLQRSFRELLLLLLLMFDCCCETSGGSGRGLLKNLNSDMTSFLNPLDSIIIIVIGTRTTRMHRRGRHRSCCLVRGIGGNLSDWLHVH